MRQPIHLTDVIFAVILQVINNFHGKKGEQ